MPSLDVAYPCQASSPVTSDHWSGPPQLVDRMASLAGTTPCDTIVDVGCGVGGPARRLVGLGCEVIGLDLLHPLVVEARRRTPRPVRLLTADGLVLPLRDAAVDQVWCLGALAHLGDVRRFGAEAARVLRPGGTLAISEAFWSGGRRPRFEATAPRPWRPLLLDGAARALTAAGFRCRVLPWPARDEPGALAQSDRLLRADLAEGRLRPLAILAWDPPR